ncbi:MAG TPA: AAA family ATPase [Acidimicrobiales bacterium]|nr:AAA family ATPase [Acidimicrobiales bacterium]
MAPDPSVLSALEAAVGADPANSALREHLAGLYLEAGDGAAALGHLEVLLAARPDQAEALGLAARAAEMVGDTERARAWRRLHEALAGPPRLVEGGSDGGARAGPAADTGAQVGGEAVGADAVGGAGTDWDAELLELVGQERAARVTLADVAGLERVKQRLETSFLGPLRNPELRKMYGASLRGGLLLWGPPGCGKTFLARAVAGELGAHFASVGLHDVLDMWLGNSEKKLHELFEVARRRTPSVLFFDEIDAIGHARVNLARSAGRNVVAQLLTELDGVDAANDGVFVIGATNQPWDVDPALRRPGRLDRTLLVLPPDPPAREAILRYHLRDRHVSPEPLAPVVAATVDFSGADLRLVCEEAAQRALADAVRTGVARPISVAEMVAVARELRPSSAPWLEMARNYATYANTAGEYDELVEYLRSVGKGRR